ncbi:hypothetical protein DW020_12380 [Clostridium sp. AF37-5AT]|nr:hypothetical protein [Clostridium sp. AF37-5AT]RHO94283.1 hypothetical protein DW020_12380 [Clostridium sp. AF37-5AT]
MGVYRAAIVTENGQNLIAQALANEKPLIFTSAKTSSYSYPVGTDVPALTGLQDVVQSVLPFDSKVLGGNVAQVSVRFDNDGVDQTYRIETIGLYAKIEGGAETLFSVTQATTPDEMPVQSDISPSAYIYNIQHTVQNASQITLTVNPAGTATVQDIMDIETPEFDDSGTVEGISSFPSFLETMKSKMNFFQFFRNLKAGLQFVLHAGHIVNNCVTDNAGLPLSAAQGKVLKDLYTQLYSDSNRRFLIDKAIYNSLTDLPSKGSCFGVIGNAPILINDFFSIPAYSRFAFINTGDSTDGALLAIDANGDVYSAYRNNGVWNTGQVSASKSDLYSKPEYSTKYLNNESVSLKMTHDQNVLIIGHSIANGNPNGHFVYLFCAGNKTSNTGKSFKIAGDFELSYSWADGLNVSISVSSSQWIQTSILYL